ncbi:MAG: FKBP-type peptidyl-prolyl cis-trans isomerase [Gammaproteobacteria bacterium]
MPEADGRTIMADIEALTIGPGSQVTMHFTLSLTDGTVADSTEEGEPMTFTMGDGMGRIPVGSPTMA